MTQTFASRIVSLTALVGVLSIPAHAALITNGSFESGLSGWTQANQTGSEGTFQLHSGTTSPVNGFTVPAPAEGANAAMTDAQGPGSHVLYQDIFIPLAFPRSSLTFMLFLGNNNGSPDYFSPETLDFATQALNQQARVDLISMTADVFSVDPADILQNLYRTVPGQPLESGYTRHTVDISNVLQAFEGQTIRLRFAAVDNVAPFNVGVDAVDVSQVPEPSSAAMALTGLALAVYVRWKAIGR